MGDAVPRHAPEAAGGHAVVPGGRGARALGTARAAVVRGSYAVALTTQPAAGSPNFEIR